MRNDINGYIYKILPGFSGRLAEMEHYAAGKGIPVVRPEVARLLLLLGMLKKPYRILELGTAIGYSAIMLSSTLAEGGRLDTIEKDEAMCAAARTNIREAGLEGIVNLIQGDVLEVLQCIRGPYDFIFIDAAKGQYPEYLPECLRLLGQEGVMVSDNVLYKGMVAGAKQVPRRQKTIVRRLQDYLEALCGTNGLFTTILPCGDGVAISMRTGNKPGQGSS